MEEIVCGNFPISDRATPRRTGKCFFKGNIYREYIVECRGVSEYWLSLNRFIVSINRKGFFLLCLRNDLNRNERGMCFATFCSVLICEKKYIKDF